MIEIKLTKGYVAIVDDVDADLADFKWYPLKTKAGHVYAYRAAKKSEGKGTLLMHRVIGKRMEQRELIRSDDVDHIDRNGLNNSRSNLRVCSRSENMMNKRRPSNNTNGFKGVTYVASSHIKPWFASICVNGEKMSLGYHLTAEAAHAAYCEAAQKYFGEFWRAV